MATDDFETFFGGPDDDGELERISRMPIYIRKHKVPSGRKPIEDLDADGISTQSNDEYESD